MLLYDYGKIYQNFNLILQNNRQKAMLKKQQYLQRIVQIFTQFVKKCEKQIDTIINDKINKLQQNYQKVQKYFNTNLKLNLNQKSLIIVEFLVKPFQRFPFSGTKNQKLFKQQYNLVQKASILIQQTLVDSFKQDQIPTFENNKFFETIKNHGIGKQSLTRLLLNPQNFILDYHSQFQPLQKNVSSIKILNNNILALIGDDCFIEFWDLETMCLLKKLYLDILAEISCLCLFNNLDDKFLIIGYSDQCPQIWIYRIDKWICYGISIIHTQQITKLLQYKNFLFSGSKDGRICLHNWLPFEIIQQCTHISSIEDLIIKNNYIYLLLKSSIVCQYHIQGQQIPILHFRRTLSAGYISIIRFPQLTSNFNGVACHIYGLSQIEITNKFKIQQTNIINIVQMISDFIVLQSKQTSQFFAICTFQNSSAIRIYSLLNQQLIYQMLNQYQAQVGVAGYLPKMQIIYINSNYFLIIICHSQFVQDYSKVKMFQLKI